ncbi:DUF4124 domain-containing protein [Shewanella sp. A3A]|nr:DUF4124 domain-containing protein [Shewanella ferrihydritica]
MERRLWRWLLFLACCSVISLLVWQLDNRWFNRSLAGYIARLEVQLQYFCYEQQWQTCAVTLKQAQPIVANVAPASGIDSRLEFHTGICSAAATNVRPQPQQAIYQWTDNNCTVHFADHPASASAQRTQYQSPSYNFDLSISALSSGIKPFFKDRLSASLRQIDDIYRTLLPAEALRPVRVNVSLTSSKATYDNFYRRYHSITSPTQGFYSHSDNLAVVWYRNDDQGFATAVHEAVHVMNAAQFGSTPRWFNEGMAEYFENMELDGFNVLIHPIEWQSVRRAPTQLSQLFSATNQDWANNQARLYANSHALIYFLMSDATGKMALKDLFAAIVHFRCQPIDVVQTLNSSYPGGLSQLERDWHNWLKRPTKAVVVS